MSLQIHFECPECNQELPLDVMELAPGRRQVCQDCQTPARMTEAALELFSKELYQYCQS